MNLRLRFFVPLVLLLLSACAKKRTDDGSGCPEGAQCTSAPRTPARGHRADGTVDVTAEELWPNRGPEPAALTPEEIAEACAILARCDTSGSDRGTLLLACVDPTAGMFYEERAVPTLHKNERWTFEARAVIASKNDCGGVQAIGTAAPDGVYCEEDGCWWQSPTLAIPRVTCAGSHATMTSGQRTWQRDCSRAFADCDPTSPTGCTDRLPMACDTPANDRCDGAFRIGCDGTGKVSFHDCSRAGGTCGDVGDGKLGCIYPDSGECQKGDFSCTNDTIHLCVLGKKVDLPASEAGFASCN